MLREKALGPGLSIASAVGFGGCACWSCRDHRTSAVHLRKARTRWMRRVHDCFGELAATRGDTRRHRLRPTGVAARTVVTRLTELSAALGYSRSLPESRAPDPDFSSLADRHPWSPQRHPAIRPALQPDASATNQRGSAGTTCPYASSGRIDCSLTRRDGLCMMLGENISVTARTRNCHEQRHVASARPIRPTFCGGDQRLRSVISAAQGQ